MFGTYVLKYHCEGYCIRKWNSIREGGIFWETGNIENKALMKLSKYYDAISFEKHSMHKKMSLLLSHKVFRNIYFYNFFERIKCRLKNHWMSQ